MNCAPHSRRRLAAATLSAFTAALLTAAGCQSTGHVATDPAPAPLFAVPARELPDPLVVIGYGDVRFTDPAESAASSPRARQALVRQIAAEAPAAVFINGDLPWHGNAADYAVFAMETTVWRTAGLRVYPALGNHEFSQCEEAQCLAYWWDTFPTLRDHRWYAVSLGSRLMAINLDSDASLLPGSPQRRWLEQSLTRLPHSVEFVLISLHHPPVTAVQEGLLASHNVRADEASLAEWLERTAPARRARVVVSAGHVHNYERFERGGVTYLVAGGGGARPYPIVRAADDLYRGTDFPNYHYVRFTLRDRALTAEMVRLANPDGDAPAVFEVRDRFEVRAR
jgi:acid phosphatase type 7